MKKILAAALLICCSFCIQAQESKPTKEQTIAFIKRYFEGNYFFRCDDQNMKYTVDNYIIDFNVETNLFKIEYVETDFYNGNVFSKSKCRITIDMSKIESVKRWAEIISSSCRQYNGQLKFEVVSGEHYKIKYERIGLKSATTWEKLQSVTEVTVFYGL